MDTQPTKKNWILTAEVFEGLLLALAPDVERGAVKYELIRQKLIRFFRVKGSFAPEEQADEVFERVARRLSEGETLDMEKPDGYFLQTARFVFLEECRSLKKKTSSLEDLPPGFEPYEDTAKTLEILSERIEREIGLDILAECRTRLSADELLMIDVYDYGSGRERIERREALAKKLGKNKNQLRIAVCRTNAKLRECAVKKLGKTLGRNF